MKTQILIIVLLVTTTILFSCDKKETKDSIIIPNQEDLTPYFDVYGGSESVMFTASSEWVAVVLNDSENKWVSVSPSNGQGGDGTLFITAKENTTTDDRTATIELRCGTAKKQILATQRQKNSLVLTKSKFDVLADGDTVQIEVKANVDYTVSIDEKSAGWIEKEQTKSIQTTTFNIVVAKNEEVTPREGKVVVSDGTLSETIVISQYGATPTIVVSEHEYVIPSSGETIEIEVNHNVNVSVSKSASWVSLVDTKGMTTNTYTFYVAANDGYNGRETDIKFINTSNGISETVHIEQLQKDAIVKAQDEYRVRRSGGTIDVIIGHNVEFSTSIDVGWITEVSTKGYVTDTLTFFVSENTSGKDRAGEIAFTSLDGKIKQKIKVFQSNEDYKDLSADGTANCYLISAPGMYGFNGTVKGNSAESVGKPVSAEVLWESFGTSTAPKVGDIINDVSFNDGVVIFSTPEKLKNGNAVIAVKDNSGTILWSWHIWVCEGYDPVATQQIYANNAGTMMDRNLGATSATPGDVHALGLLYQWGRKDPFLSGSSPESTVAAASSVLFPPTVASSSSVGTIDYSIKHPMTLLYRSIDFYDWVFENGANVDKSRWYSKKTYYDPCPSGWIIPTGGPNNIWAVSGFSQSIGQYSSTNRGYNFPSSITGTSSWYPSAGYWDWRYGDLIYVGEKGFYWTTYVDEYNVFRFDTILNQFLTLNESAASCAHSVRCCKE